MSWCEMPQVYGREFRKARKEHKCCECLGKIKSGERYHYHHGIWDGRASEFKVCVDCEQLRNKVDKNERDPEFRTPFEGLYESVFERRYSNEIEKFLEIKRLRGSEIPKWMTDRYEKLKGKTK